MEFACVRKTEVGVSGGLEFSSGQKPLVSVMGGGFAISLLVLSVWIVLWIMDYYIKFLWLELWMSKLSSSDVGHKYNPPWSKWEL